jgi:hypothetical protein
VDLFLAGKNDKSLKGSMGELKNALARVVQ